MKARGQLKYQMELNFQLYAPSICVLSNAPTPLFVGFWLGIYTNFAGEKLHLCLNKPYSYLLL